MHIVWDLFARGFRYLPLTLMPRAKYSGCVRNFIYDAHNSETLKIQQQQLFPEIVTPLFQPIKPLVITRSLDPWIIHSIWDTFSRKIYAVECFKHISLL